MATSPNGWPLLVMDRTTTFSAGGRRWRTAPGLVASVFAAFLNRYALEVEPIVDEPATRGQLDDWGWADRPQRDSTKASNHWSGTAIDVNSLQHLRGVENTFTPTELRALRALLNDFPVLRWGGDYGKTPGSKAVVDDMHVEVNVTPRVLAVWCARHLPAAAVPRVAAGSPNRPTPQEDDVVTRADMETIADLVVERWSQRTLEAPHPVNAGQSAPISFENLLRRAASVIPDGVKRGVLRTPEDWAVEILDRELVRTPHPQTDEEDDITLRMALGRAASVITDGVNRGVLQDTVDLEPATLVTGEVVASGWSPDDQASLLAGAEAQRTAAAAVEKIGNQIEELLGIAGWLYERATTPEPVLIAGSTDTATQAEMIAQTHARTVQVTGLVAGVAGALNVLATAAAKGRMADAQVLQDTMLDAIREAMPQVTTPEPASAGPLDRAPRGA